MVADGFYEWQRAGKRRQPMFIHMRDDRPMAFAGLWESWEGPGHSALESCTILTTAANDLVRPIHDRMPVIVAPQDYAQWLDPAVQTPEPILPLLRPYPSGPMEAYAVGTQVNSPAQDDSDAWRGSKDERDEIPNPKIQNKFQAENSNDENRECFGIFCL